MRNLYSFLIAIQILLLICFSTLTAKAQLSGTYTVGVAPGSDFATVKLAVDAINAQGISGPTIILMDTSTEVNSNIVLQTTTTNATNTLTFQSQIPGTYHTIVAGTGTGTMDGVFIIYGSDYVTVKDLKILENTANTDNTTRMEWGIALLKPNAANGTQYCAIRNCIVSLNNLNTISKGIFSGNHTKISTSQITVTNISGTNSNNSIDSCLIMNCHDGIYFSGYNHATAPYQFYDQNNSIGVTHGNTIINFGGGGSLSYGIYAQLQNNLIIQKDSVYNVMPNSYINAIFSGLAKDANVKILDNYVQLSKSGDNSPMECIKSSSGSYGSGNKIIISNNKITNSSLTVPTGYANFTGIASGTTDGPDSLIMENNSISYNDMNGAGIFWGIIDEGSLHCIMNNNTVYDNQQTGSGGLLGIRVGGKDNTVTNNMVDNLYVAGSSDLTGIEIFKYSYGTRQYLANNIISNLTRVGVGKTWGIYSETYAVTEIDFTNNDIHSFYSPSNGYTIGISVKYGDTVNIGNNRIYDLSGGSIYGLEIRDEFNEIHVLNNMFSDFKLSSSNDEWQKTGTFVWVFCPKIEFTNNTYFLNIQSVDTSSFISTCLHIADVDELLLRNNIFVNMSSCDNGGKAFCLQIPDTTLSFYSELSNNNLFYTNPSDSSAHILCTGANSYGFNYYHTLPDFKTIVYPRDKWSVTELPPFINQNISPFDLHLRTDVPTQAESGGIPGLLFTDIDDEGRVNVKPDIGADEFAGIILDITAPEIEYPILLPVVPVASRLFDSVTIIDNHAIDTANGTAPRVYYKRTYDSNIYNDNTNLTDGWKFSEAFNNGSPFRFTIDHTLLYGGTGVAEGDTIEYFVVAQDTATVPNACINSAVTASPITGVNLNSAHFPVSGPINFYTILQTICGNFTVGQTGDFQNLTAASTTLNQRVITCPVTFELLQDYNTSTETFPVVFNSNLGSSTTNTVTIRPASGADIVIADSSVSSILKLNGADNFIIDGSNNGSTSRNLTIENTSASSNQAAIWIASQGAGAGSNHITIKNCEIKAGTTTATSFAVFSGGSAIATSGTGADNSFLTIENNKICKAQYGIFCSGTTASFFRNLFVSNNEIGSDTATEYISAKGIYFTNIDSATIAGNNIHDIHAKLSSPAYGIELGRHSNVVIEKNIIQRIIYSGSDFCGAQGIYVNSPVNANLVIANNIIKGLKGNGAFSVANTTWGIYLYYLNSCNIHFNTISISDEMPYYFGSDRIGCIQISSFASGVNISNNIFCITGKPGDPLSGKITGILNHGSISSIPILDYNAYFLTSPFGQVAMQGPYPHTTYTSLQSWQNASGKDAHSVFVNPDFVNPDDLHPTSIILNDKGTFLIDFPSDFDGIARNTSSPDIGAYEFSPLNNNLTLVNLAIPNSAGCKTNHETVTATIVNKGLNPIDFSTNPLSISASANGPLMQSFVQVVSSGSLLSLDSLVIIVTDSFDATIPGTYSFLSNIFCNVDQNSYDDSLYIPYEFTSINPTVSINASDTLILSGQNSQLFAQTTTSGCLNSTTSYYSNNIVSIPDQTTVYDSIVVTDSLIEASFLDQIVIDSLLHTWDDDLSIYICTPSGDTVLLTSNNGDDGDNYISTVFSQNATNSITSGVAPFTGMFLTENTSIAHLSGPGAGSWKLIINDRANGDTGTLLKWHLVFKSPNIISDYDWTPAATVSDPSVADPLCTPSSNTWYTVTVTDSLGCSASDSILITVITVPSPVYPGDISNNGLVDGNDLLLLGLNYNVSGSPRDSVSIEWLPQTSFDWGANMSGAALDLKFADCNGDGITLYSDTNAISQNFGLTHTFKTDITPDFPKATPTVSLLFPDTILVNTPTQIDVVLGDAANPFTDLHGINFDFSLNTNFHITNFTLTSLLAAPANQLKLLKNTGTNEYSLAFTKTDGTGFNGYGSAATITVVFDSILGLPFNTTATVSNAVCLNADGTWNSPTGSASSFILASGTTVQINEPESNLNLNIHPNPASTQTEISFTLPAPGKCVLTLRNTLGELIQTTTVDGQSGKNSVNVDLSRLGQGIYVYTLEYKDVMLTRRLSVMR